MKKLSVLTAILCLFILNSCSSSHEPKEISPSSTDFTSGELAKLIEVVDAPCQLSYVEKDGRIESQYLMLKVQLRLTKESPALQKADPRDIDFTSLTSVATVNLVDENGLTVQELGVKQEDLLKLKKLVQKKVGDVETITFAGEFYNPKEVIKWFEQTKSFIPNLTGGLACAHTEPSAYTEEREELGLNLTGKLGGSDDAVLTYDENTDEGELKFTVNGVLNVRKVKMGSYDKNSNTLILKEFFANGNYVGDFKGIWKDGIYQGVFTNTKGGRVDFILHGTGNYEFSGAETANSHNDNLTTGTGGSEDWDALLTAYEVYVDKYISYVRKAANGDMTALVEYPSLMEKAQEFSNKLQKAQGSMSSSQLARYNNITMKMMKAAEAL